MKCPNCNNTIRDEDVDVSSCAHSLRVYISCPECKKEYTVEILPEELRDISSE